MDLLIEDLLRLFGETVASQSRPVSITTPFKTVRISENGATAAASEELEEEVRDVSTSSLVNTNTTTTRDSFVYEQGKTMSIKLAQVIYTLVVCDIIKGSYFFLYLCGCDESLPYCIYYLVISLSVFSVFCILHNNVGILVLNTFFSFFHYVALMK